jgi:23S rRNA pseudouridine1911/1915/1917 synthase
MSDEQTFIVETDAAGVRLDRYLAARLPDFSRSQIQTVIREGGVRHNGGPARASEPVRAGDTVTWIAPAPKPCLTAEAEDIPLDIMYEDEHLIVLNKPAGMVVHPGAGNVSGTLVSALLHHCGSLSLIGGVERPGIVHRLDKETSGCLVVAKNDRAHHSLAAQFANREVKKTYLAVTAGVPRYRAGKVDAPIARHRVHRQKMAVSEPGDGRDALTEYTVLASANGRALIECKPRTGRTHQIRVHLRHLGCPILGDPLYGRRGTFTRHMLHAWKLEFRHPVTGETLRFEAKPPPEFTVK